MSDTVSTLEITWTMLSVIAIGCTAWIVDDNVRNFNAIREAVRQGRAVAWGPRWWVALASLVSSCAMFLVWLVFATIGVLAMTTSVHSDPLYRMWIATVTGWGLILATLILAGIQVWQVYARTKIRPLIAPPHGSVDEAADQAQHAADLIDALRPVINDPEPPQDKLEGVRP